MKPVFDKAVSVDEFIDKVVDYIFNEQWEQEDKEYVAENDSSWLYHYTIGLGIRNTFVYPYLEKFDFTDGDMHPDTVSDTAMRKLIEKAKKCVK